MCQTIDINDISEPGPHILIRVRKDIASGNRNAIDPSLCWHFPVMASLLRHQGAGRPEAAIEEIDRRLLGFARVEGIGPCGWCAGTGAPYRNVADITALCIDGDDHPGHVPEEEVAVDGEPDGIVRKACAGAVYGADLTCPDCGSHTGTCIGDSPEQADTAARQEWRRLREEA